jgi:hypothetical protein
MGLFARDTMIERLARKTGWVVISREADVYRLRAGDHSRPYTIRVRCRDDYLNVTFLANLPVQFPLASMTKELATGLLVRNCRLLWAKWCLEVAGSCDALPFLYAAVQTQGLTGETFDAICRCMIGEIQAVHDELRGQVARFTDGGAGRLRVQPGGDTLPLDHRGIRFLE